MQENGNGKNKKGFRKYLVIAFFLIAAAVSALFAGKVKINYNVSDYLNKKSETKVTLSVIEKEFDKTGDVQVMIKNVSETTAKDVKKTLENIENVLVVNFDSQDENYFKDGNALFVMVTDGDEYSDSAAAVLGEVRAALDEKFDGDVSYGGTVVAKKKSSRINRDGNCLYNRDIRMSRGGDYAADFQILDRTAYSARVVGRGDFNQYGHERYFRRDFVHNERGRRNSATRPFDRLQHSPAA